MKDNEFYLHPLPTFIDRLKANEYWIAPLEIDLELEEPFVVWLVGDKCVLLVTGTVNQETDETMTLLFRKIVGKEDELCEYGFTTLWLWEDWMAWLQDKPVKEYN